MSLIRIAARISLVEALKGNTAVGDNVRDSMIGALEVDADGNLRTEQDRPFLAVYSESAKYKPDVDLRSIRGNGATEFVFEFGVTAAMVETNEVGESTIVGIGIPATDDAMEFLMDLTAGQIADVLTDPGNVWAEVFRSLAGPYQSVERARTSNAQDGVRLAGQQIKIVADLIDDPVRGEALDPASPLKTFFDLADTSADTSLQAKSTAMKTLIVGTNEPWELTQKRLGLSAADLLALGLGPLAVDDLGAVPTFDTGTLDIDQHGSHEVLPE